MQGDLFTGGCGYGNDALVKAGKLDKHVNEDSIVYTAYSPLDMFILVGDDHRYLENAVKSIYDICGQVILIQTSNSFRMSDVLDLSKYPKVTHRYYPWNNSYSAARNFALLFVRPKAKWIGYIDCDERLVHAENTLAVLENQPDNVGAVILSIVGPHYYPEGTRMLEGTNIRFFRAWHQYYFIHDVHEQIGAAIQASGKIAVTIEKQDSYIAHLGYDLTSEEMLVKTMKYREMLNADKRKYPKDGAVYYHSAKNYSMLNIDVLAVEDYMTAIGLLSTSKAVKAECYAALAGYANKQSQFDAAISYATKGLGENPENLLATFNLAYSLYRLKEYQKAYDILSAASLGNRADSQMAKDLLIYLGRILNGEADSVKQLDISKTERPSVATRLAAAIDRARESLQNWPGNSGGPGHILGETKESSTD